MEWQAPAEFNAGMGGRESVIPSHLCRPETAYGPSTPGVIATPDLTRGKQSRGVRRYPVLLRPATLRSRLKARSSQ